MVWTAIDLDGTLAEYTGPLAGGNIGKPIPQMVERVKGLIADGRKVKIFTARVSSRGDHAAAQYQRWLIENWCIIHLGRALEVTAEKDYEMLEMWDDRAREVVPNTGEFRR